MRFSDLKIDLNIKDNNGNTALHIVACLNSEIAEMIIKNSSELKIDLNSKEECGWTAFHLACCNGHSDIAEMIMKNASALNIDLYIKDNCGWTAFHLACLTDLCQCHIGKFKPCPLLEVFLSNAF